MKPIWYKTHTDKRGLHWLFYYETDNETETNTLHQIVMLDGYTVDVSIKGIPDDKIQGAMDDLNPPRAVEILFQHLLKLGAVGPNGEDILSESEG